MLYASRIVSKVVDSQLILLTMEDINGARPSINGLSQYS